MHFSLFTDRDSFTVYPYYHLYYMFILYHIHIISCIHDLIYTFSYIIIRYDQRQLAQVCWQRR